MDSAATLIATAAAVYGACQQASFVATGRIGLKIINPPEDV
jgi:hypothetical protein